jgi:hypothetical protein
VSLFFSIKKSPNDFLSTDSHARLDALPARRRTRCASQHAPVYDLVRKEMITSVEEEVAENGKVISPLNRDEVIEKCSL